MLSCVVFVGNSNTDVPSCLIQLYIEQCQVIFLRCLRDAQLNTTAELQLDMAATGDDFLRCVMGRNVQPTMKISQVTGACPTWKIDTVSDKARQPLLLSKPGNINWNNQYKSDMLTNYIPMVVNEYDYDVTVPDDGIN